jgi:hypothetical protein
MDLVCLVNVDSVSLRVYSTWYRDARRHLVSLFGFDAVLFANILAATSPRVAVRKNWRLAVKAYGQWRAHGCLYDSAGFMPCHVQNVKRAFAGLPLSGDKVRRFAANLCGDLDAVTIDVWICKAYGLEHKTLTRAVYEALEAQIRRDAEAVGLPAAEYQAVLWHVVRRWHGRRDKSFPSVSVDRQGILFAV